MATFLSTNLLGKRHRFRCHQIEVQRRKGEPIPAGWALDEHGVVTTDAEAAMKGSLLPLGGSEATSGHKGYGLQLLVEILCGITSGESTTITSLRLLCS